MKLFDELQRVVQSLKKYPAQWAVCGGVAASIYRASARFTDDIDIALVDSDAISAEDLAIKITRSLGYKEYKGFIPDLKSDGKQVFGLIQAKDNNSERFAGIDFLLPVQFWVADAVRLAQKNVIDYGFSMLPTITPESLIIAKLAALQGSPGRLQDLDDVQEILKSMSLDLGYLKKEIEENKLQLPGSLKGKIF